ncbi:MAG TPA: D-glycerate dehydrogenase [Thermopetrobacter sp.]|nr:D-glycerate dehydrogenase [Thermopetrobacter sp.]
MTTEKDRPRIAVTRRLPDAVERRLRRDYDIWLNEDDRQMDAAAILDAADGMDGLLVCPTEKIDAALIPRLPAGVRIIATFSVGYDHIDIAAAERRGIMVTHTPQVLTEATADMAVLLLLGAARGAHWGARMVREGRWGRWGPRGPLGLDVKGRTAGVFGMGRIGRAFAERAAVFGLSIHYHNRRRLPPELERGAVYHETLEDMLPLSDFLVITCASTEQTRHRINAAALARLPENAVVVNVARGDIIVDDDLIAALDSGHLAAAGLDVFNNEPHIDPRYRDHPKVFATPHIGSATPGVRDAMGFRALDNLDAFFRGERPPDALTDMEITA